MERHWAGQGPWRQAVIWTLSGEKKNVAARTATRKIRTGIEIGIVTETVTEIETGIAIVIEIGTETKMTKTRTEIGIKTKIENDPGPARSEMIAAAICVCQLLVWRKIQA